MLVCICQEVLFSYQLHPHFLGVKLLLPAVSGDKSIIDIALQYKRLTMYHLQQLSLVHIHLQVYFVSNLVRPGSFSVLDFCMNRVVDK